MGWEPTVLRKYNTTGHFRLLSQLRSVEAALKRGSDAGDAFRDGFLLNA